MRGRARDRRATARAVPGGVRQEAEGWGTKVIDRLAADLQREFQEMTGLSRTNLKYMRALAKAYAANEIGQQAVGQIA
ncbi:MAG TPA: DUF1016 N-terminal domain-containing protein [Longimicrobium sp.]|jgi:hypothetical protein